MSIATSRTTLVTALSLVVGLAGAGCGGTGIGIGASPTGAPAARAPSTRSAHTQNPPHPSDSRQDDAMKIKITIGEQRFHAALSNSAATRDLIDQLPVTIDMVDHGGVEKTGPLTSPLSLDGQPEGADPDVGDLGYYAPGNHLVLYYGDQGYYPGIVVLGRVDGSAAERIATMDGSVRATIEVSAE